MIQIRIPSNMEDRFNLLLNDWLRRQNNDYFKNNMQPCLSIEDGYIDWIFNVGANYVNMLFDFFIDLEDVQGITPIFRYIRSTKQAYTGFDERNSRSIPWCKFTEEPKFYNTQPR